VHSIALKFIKPGKPTQNSYVERFNRTYRTECSIYMCIKTLNEVFYLTEKWVTAYNEERLHEALDGLTPWKYLSKHEQAETFNYECN